MTENKKLLIVLMVLDLVMLLWSQLKLRMVLSQVLVGDH